MSLLVNDYIVSGMQHILSALAKNYDAGAGLLLNVWFAHASYKSEKGLTARLISILGAELSLFKNAYRVDYIMAIDLPVQSELYNAQA